MTTLLVATDDANLFAMLEAEASAHGFDGRWAADGKDAFEQVLTGLPDCIMIDATISVFSVWELCHMLRNHPDIPQSLPIFLISDEALSARKLESFAIAEVIPRAHDTSLLRELLFRHVAQ